MEKKPEMEKKEKDIPEAFKILETEERKERAKKGLFSKDPPKENPPVQQEASKPIEGQAAGGQVVDSEENMIDYRNLKHGDYELHVDLKKK